jgi:hypothetical protein
MNQNNEIDILKELLRNAENRLDEGAKQLITLNGFLQTLLLAGFTLTDLRDIIQDRETIFILSVVCLLISLLCSILYFYPQKTTIIMIGETIEEINSKELHWRSNFLRWGQISFLCGLFAVSFVILLIATTPKEKDSAIQVILLAPTSTSLSPTLPIVPQTTIPASIPLISPTP